MRAWVVMIVGLVLAAAPCANAQQFNDPDLGRRVTDAAADADHLWLRGETGNIVQFDRQTGARTILFESAIDMLVDGGRIWVLVQSEPTGQYLLREVRLREPSLPPGEADRQRLAFYAHPSRNSEGEVIGLMAWPASDRPAVLTIRTLQEPIEAGWKRRPLAADLNASEHIATTGGSSVYVGYNRGEWGGGLRRIDVETGSVAFVRERSDTPCSGALNPMCSPIVGLFADRNAEGCLIVGSGLAHLHTTRGEVFRVCGTDISGVFSTPAREHRDPRTFPPGPWPLFGLFEAPGGWIGISQGRYFRSINGTVADHAMPEFSEWSGLRISRDEDGVLFLVSACCWGSATRTDYSVMAIPVMD